MNKENCALKLVNEIILYYDARSKKHQFTCCAQHVQLEVLCDLYVSTCILVFMKMDLKFEDETGKVNYEFFSPF